MTRAVPISADQSCKPVVGHFEAFGVPPGQGHCPSDTTSGDYIGTLCTP